MTAQPTVAVVLLLLKLVPDSSFGIRPSIGDRIEIAR